MSARTKPLEAGESILRLSSEEVGLLRYVLQRAAESSEPGNGRAIAVLKRKVGGGELRLSREYREVLHYVLSNAMRHPEVFAGHKQSLGAYFSQSIERIKNKLPKQGAGTYGD